MKRILVINFGSTSSKLAVFEDETQVADKTINYTRDELTNFKKMTEQLPLRRQGVLDWLKEIGREVTDFDAISVRGGVTQPLEPGAYKVNQEMVDRLTNAPLLDHPSNMTPMVAWELTKEYGVPSYIYDPIFDHMLPVAKITGIPEIKRTHMGHIENMRAVSLKMAKELGKPVTECNFIVAHLGGGITMCCEENGRFIDFNDSSNSPFSPERAGVIPARQFSKLIYSGKYSEAEITKLITGRGGMFAHLGTTDCREVEQRIADGDEQAKVVYEAMAYQTAKCIGAFAAVLKGNIDAIILTGGIANSRYFTNYVSDRVGFLAPVKLYPGEFEMESLGLGILRVLNGEEEATEYVDDRIKDELS